MNDLINFGKIWILVCVKYISLFTFWKLSTTDEVMLLYDFLQQSHITVSELSISMHEFQGRKRVWNTAFIIINPSRSQPSEKQSPVFA